MVELLAQKLVLSCVDYEFYIQYIFTIINDHLIVNMCAFFDKFFSFVASQASRYVG